MAATFVTSLDPGRTGRARKFSRVFGDWRNKGLTPGDLTRLLPAWRPLQYLSRTHGAGLRPTQTKRPLFDQNDLGSSLDGKPRTPRN